MEPLRIVLLGATGFVGGALLRQLDAADAPNEVRALTHRTPLAHEANWLRQERGSLLELPRTLLPAQPHVVIHCASKQIDRDGRGFDENVRGVGSLIAALNPATRAVIYSSSFSVYGDGRQRAIDEDAPLRPETSLARSRAEAERLLIEHGRAADRSIVILRTRFVIGRGDRYVLPTLRTIAAARVGIASGRQRYSMIDVDDYARIMLRFARRLLSAPPAAPTQEAFNVGYAQPISFNEIMTTIRAERGLPPARLRLPVNRPLLAALGRLPSSTVRQWLPRLRLLGYDRYADIGKLRAALDDPLLATDPQEALRAALRRDANA